ncbi:lipopolysaccharide biosynthesis protein [Halopelagius longus]|uniref:Lipopolysaccharide biosynthesis protein n=1 Tax=Halopelagius longus TaxID=1236180 RepID=A0A1H1ANF1_9EURY|nr:lipopolysaccharide biosynthesis protein [Halopelagius longus]RDI70457.1 lipopolysaccharide biosynthesis protein [Halopelagius longus]SDQ41288.1 polysaccharide transporter, PST family/lipopolysaccharide exporter [Halopelagius longus]
MSRENPDSETSSPGTVASILSRLKPTGELTDQIIKGGLWATALNVSDRALVLVELVILGRVLGPSQYGLISMCILTIIALRRFTHLGFDEAIIQKPSENVDDYFDTIWTIRVLRGVLVAGVMFAVGPLIASLWGEPRVSEFLRLTGLVLFFVGLQNPAVVYLRKDLEFDKELVFKLSGTVVEFVIAIVLVYRYQTVWAFVIGRIAAEAMRAVVSFKLTSYSPRFDVDVQQTKHLLGYGQWIFSAGLIGFLIGEGDDVFVGWLLGSGALAIYQMSYKISNTPATEISQVLTSVMFPAFSKLQNDIDALRETYKRTVQISSLFSFPAAFGIALVAPEFVHLAFGEEWQSAIVVIQILAGWGLLRSVGHTSGPLLNAVGRPKTVTKIQIVKLSLIAVLIYPVTEAWGIVGTGLLITGNAFVVLPWSLFIVARELETTIHDLLRPTFIPFGASVAMSLVVLATANALPTLPALAALCVKVLLGVLAYVLALAVMLRFVDNSVAELVETVLQSFSN